MENKTKVAYGIFALVVLIVGGWLSHSDNPPIVVNNTDAGPLFSITTDGDKACGTICISYVNITFLRAPSVDDDSKFTLATDVQNQKYKNIEKTVLDGKEGTSFVHGVDVKVMEYKGQKCELVNVSYVVDEKEVVEETENCNPILEELDLKEIEKRKWKENDVLQLAVIGSKNPKDNVKWGIRFGDAYVDPVWNGFFGFDFPSSGVSASSYDVNDSIANKFQVNETMTVIAAYVYKTVGQYTNFTIGIQADNGSNYPLGTWLGTNNNATCNSTFAKNTTAFVGCMFNESVQLVVGTTYWVVARIDQSAGYPNFYSLAEISPGSVENVWAFNMSDLNFGVGRNITSWTYLTGNAPVFLLAKSDGSVFGNPYSIGTNRIYSDDIYGQVIYADERINVSEFGTITRTQGTPLCDLEFNLISGVATSSWASNRIFAINYTGINVTVGYFNVSISPTITLNKGSTYTILLRDSNNTCTSSNYYRFYSAIGNSSDCTYDGERSYRYYTLNNGSSWSSMVNSDSIFRFTYVAWPDTTRPNVSSLSIYPRTAQTNSSITINATVVDDVGVQSVYATIQYPSGNLENWSMTSIGSDIYQLNFSNTSTEGSYNITHIIANDTSDNVNDTTFTIPQNDFNITAPLGTPDTNASVWNGVAWVGVDTYTPLFRCTATQSDCEPVNQSAGSSQCIFRVHNNGTVAGTDVQLKLSATKTNYDIKCDDDYTSADAITLTTNYQTISGALDADSTADICCWADLDNPLGGLIADVSFNVTG